MLGTRDCPADTGWDGNLRTMAAYAAGPFNKHTSVDLLWMLLTKNASLSQIDELLIGDAQKLA